MEENYEKEIKEIMAGMDCTRNFACCKSGFQPRCEVKDVELQNHLEIEGDYDFFCKYLVVSNGVRYCKCPLCVYLTKRPGNWNLLTNIKRLAMQKILSTKQDTQ